MADKRKIKQHISTFPDSPGVYIMKDVRSKVIYVGKAKSLKSRIKSYFTASGDEREQVQYLVELIEEIDYIITDSEQHAFLLERDLIFKHKPRFNIKLKDDKTYLSIRVDDRVDWPKLELVRQRRRDGATYYGPFSFSYELRTLMRVIHRVVPLRSCSDQVFGNRLRPCLEYQIKRCCGPCVLDVDKQWYASLVQKAKSILEGKTAPLLKELEENMERASSELRFEDAAEYRDKLEILERFTTGQRLISHREEDRDVLGLYREGHSAVISFLLVRGGRIADSKSFVLDEVHLSSSEIISEALIQFYIPGRELPQEILLPIDLGEEDYARERLEQLRGSKIKLTTPSRGIGRRLIGLAELNAQENYFGKLTSAQRYSGVAEELQRQFRLVNAPRRIECVDISHIQGSDVVGALVCFFDGKPYRKGYRKYPLPEFVNQDDFGAIYEVVRRRLQEAERSGELPDLLVIDGGMGQLGAALKARKDSNVQTVDIIAIAKERKDQVRSSELKVRHKPERVFVESSKVPIVLKKGEGITNLLARVRDEVHGYVISAHRRARLKRGKQSVLDQVPGIGPRRKMALLKVFGTIEKIAESSPELIAAETSVPYGVAEELIGKLTKK